MQFSIMSQRTVDASWFLIASRAVGAEGAHSTVVYTVMKIWLEILGVFGTKICYFIRKNIAENGPLEFRTVLCSNLCQMVAFDEKKRSL